MDYNRLKEFFKNDHFAVGMGAEITAIVDGAATARVKVTREHLNAGGVTQGGVIFTLGDYAMAAAANSHGKVAFSMQAEIKYLISAKEGATLTATAREVSVGRTIANYSVEIHDDAGQLIASGSSILYRKNIELFPEE